MENNVKNLNAFLKTRKVTMTSVQKKATREYAKECSAPTVTAESTVKTSAKSMLKPFDLEEALNGAPVITRDGREVTEIYCFETSGSKYTVYACIDGQVYPYVANGKYFFNGETESKDDLFMGQPVLINWVNVYCNKEYIFLSSTYPSEEKAMESARKSTNASFYVKTIKIHNQPE